MYNFKRLSSLTRFFQYGMFPIAQKLQSNQICNFSLLKRTASSATWFKRIEQEKKEREIKHAEAKALEASFDAEAWEAGLSDEAAKRLKVLQLEYDVMLGTGEKVPEVMTSSMWKDIFDCPSASKRTQLYKYFFITENRIKKEKEKKINRKVEFTDPPKIVFEGGYQYAILERAQNTFMRKIEREYMNQFQYRKLYNALKEDQKIVFDMDYDSLMRPRDITNLVKQVLLCYGYNKMHIDPYYFIFCNMKVDGMSYQKLQHASASTPLAEYPFTLTEKSYLDIFPKERLVYLSPDAPDVMTKYNHDDIYIIGGLVDKIITKPVSYAKAKREGIRMAKLPLDLYVKWKLGNKSLTIDQMVNILLDIKWTGDWTAAFKHLPSRKQIPVAEWAEEVGEKREKRYKAKFSYLKKEKLSN